MPAFDHRVRGLTQAAVTSKDLQTQEEAVDKFQEILCQDRKGYDDRLDYFEINFNDAVSKLRMDARKKVKTRLGKETSIADDPESPSPSKDVEIAFARMREQICDSNYRSTLREAINSLRPEEAKVVELLLQEFLIDSKDPNELTIRKILGCSEKTVRIWRDKAFAAIKKFMTAEENA